MNVDAKIKEAEVYYSMGLIEESLKTYEEILSEPASNDSESVKGIQEKIQNLKEELKQRENEDMESISSDDVSIIQSNLPSKEESPADIMESASALQELGLLKEAAAEYERVFQFDYPVKDVIPKLTGCLFQIHSPYKAQTQIEEALKKQKLADQKLAEIKYTLALEMEEKGHKDLAIDLVKAAIGLDPENNQIKDKLKSLVASVSSGSRYDYLLGKKLVTADQLQKALAVSKKMKKSVEYVLIHQFHVKKEEVGESLSMYYDCPFKSFDSNYPVPYELINKLKRSFLLHDLWVPLNWEKAGIEILLEDPGDPNKTDLIRGLLKTKKIFFSVGIKEDIEKFINHFFENQAQEKPAKGFSVSEDLDMMPEISFEEEEEEPEEGMLDESSSQVVRFVDQCLVAAYRKSASDIHIEPSPGERVTNIRFRMDGVCQEYMQVPNTMARAIISRIKIMAGLDIAERRLPQDGKIKFKRKGIPSFEMRVATLPTAGGFEDAVLRILAKSGALPLDDLQLNQHNLNLMKQILTRPYGIILAVGPTGSGKTTTLHAALGYINKPGVKIWTAEDPIEITQRGLRQVEVKPKIGLDFARVMRSFLRADPDIIMIGEMRDRETASIGIEASLTGHLVFSTLHTNNAPETVTRLLDMGLNPLNFSDAFLGVLAQRLVRRVCPKCRKSYHPSRVEFDELVEEYGKDRFSGLGIDYSSDLTLYKAAGCEECSGTGYKGRMGIHELMAGTPEIKRLIKKAATTEELMDQAAKDGLTTLKQDGIHKVLLGLTDMTEVRRVCVD